jgi:hypothetical protein
MAGISQNITSVLATVMPVEQFVVQLMLFRDTKIMNTPKITRPKAPVRRTSEGPKPAKLKDMLLIAQQRGLLRGTRTRMVHGRMPEALVNQAKARTGIKSDTDLIEIALANLAVADDYMDWLLSQKGTISPDLDLEF